MKDLADRPKDVYEVKLLAERLIPQYKIAEDPAQMAQAFFDEHNQNEWWLNGAPIRNWKKLFEGKVKRVKAQSSGKIKPNYHKCRIAVCDVCWNPWYDYGIENIEVCNCVMDCILNRKKLQYYWDNGVKATKLAKAAFDGKVDVITPEDCAAVELYYKSSRLVYLTIYNKNPDAREIYEHIRHYRDRMVRDYGDAYYARVQPFKNFLVNRGDGDAADS